jgi:hypothetical protein
LVVDADGIAVGGLRTPWVDVPVATLSGLGQDGEGVLTFLFGTTVPFPAEKLSALYPGGVDSYRTKFDQSLADAVAKGFILAADEAEIMAVAAWSFPEQSGD